MLESSVGTQGYPNYYQCPQSPQQEGYEPRLQQNQDLANLEGNNQ